MRILCVCLILLGLAGEIKAGMSISVRESDGETLFDNRDLLPDSYLTLFIQSDQDSYWSGGIVLEGESILLGEIIARGPVIDENYTGSILPASGMQAVVNDWEDSNYDGYITASGLNPTPGDWFVFDYHAIGEGDVVINLYDDNEAERIHFVTIHQVPEPASLLLIGGGILAVCRRGKRIA